jgi:hypothetical protein
MRTSAKPRVPAYTIPGLARTIIIYKVYIGTGIPRAAAGLLVVVVVVVHSPVNAPPSSV